MNTDTGGNLEGIFVPYVPSYAGSHITTNNNKNQKKKTFFVALQLTNFPHLVLYNTLYNLHTKRNLKQKSRYRDLRTDGVFHYRQQEIDMLR